MDHYMFLFSFIVSQFHTSHFARLYLISFPFLYLLLIGPIEEPSKYTLSMVLSKNHLCILYLWSYPRTIIYTLSMVLSKNHLCILYLWSYTRTIYITLSMVLPISAYLTPDQLIEDLLK